MKNLLTKILKNRLIYHYVFWITLVISYLITHFYIIEGAGLGSYLLTSLVRNGLLIILVYGNVSFLLPLYYNRKKYIHYGVSLLLLILIYALVQSSYLVYFYTNKMHYQTGLGTSFTFQFVDSLFTSVRYTFISIILKLTLEWHDQKQKIATMQIEKLQAEINYLRAQINPHFLFNTLNSLYALTLKKSEVAPEVVMKLSKMMDYMLYDSNEVMVPLKNDIENLSNYIELEKIRLSNHDGIKFFIEGNLNNHFVLPLLFLPLVENAFKHGASQKIDDQCISITLKIQDNQIDFKVENKKPKNIINGTPFIKNRGVGLKNLQKRLELFYTNKHDFQVKDTKAEYEVTLKLKI